MKFKVGDRVATYSHEGRLIGKIAVVWDGESMLDISFAFRNGTYRFHYNQCRRLIKKKYREIWVSEEFLKEWKTLADCPHIYSSESNLTNTKGYKRFREMKD
ncbi:MAG TPA: hypothetical protein PK473_03180 [Nitrosomonas sp.]|nr:hypothetical protein [Agitococcus sp.]HNA70014.1 hypothetical protein [Nitrosomonas sp.]